MKKKLSIALFPEMFSNGYDIPEDLSILKSMAIGEEGQYCHTYDFGNE